MKAVIMAGGEGSRLRPLTVGRPKPMVPMVSKPIMAHILDHLKRQGITEVVVTLYFMPEVIQAYFGDGSNLGMKIHYAIEEAPLGTAGGIKNAQEYLDEPFIVISGDVLTDINLQDVVAFHEERGSEATLTLYRVPNPLEYGVIITDPDAKITQFLEKPSWGEVISDTVNTGIYVIDPSVLDLVEEGVPTDWSKDVFPKLLSEGRPLYGYVADGNWTDVGDIGEYMRASSDVLYRHVQTEEIGQHIGGDVWVGEGVEIAPDAQLYGPIYLGNEVKIKGGVIIHGPTVVRDYTIVDNRVHFDRSIIWRNNYIGEGAEIRGAIVGRQSTIKSKAVLFEGVVIADNCVVGEGAVLHANVKMWPEKEIDPGATVKTSIIWGARGRRVLFDQFGVTGVMNIDVTPKFSTTLAEAYGATQRKGALVTFSRDLSYTAFTLGQSAMFGMPWTGVSVLDLGVQPRPVARYFTGISNTVGGIHISISPSDQRVAHMRFFDARGLDISRQTERKIESAFFDEDVRRVSLDELGTTDYAPLIRETYIEGLLSSLDSEAIRAVGFDLAVDFASSPTADILPELLDILGCNVTALNANFDEERLSISPEELRGALNRLRSVSESVKANLGIRIDALGEKIFAVDSNGRSVRSIDLCAAMAELVLSSYGGGTVVVPVNLTHVFEQIAAEHGGQILRCKINARALMEMSTREGVVMAADGFGSFIFPQFQPAIDGLGASAKLLELLATQRKNLAEVVARLPPFHVEHREVSCLWEAKGTVMRLLNQQYKDRRAELIDGIKILLGDGQWVLVVPDADHAKFHIYAEAETDERAQDLMNRFTRIVEGLQD